MSFNTPLLPPILSPSATSVSEDSPSFVVLDQQRSTTTSSVGVVTGSRDPYC